MKSSRWPRFGILFLAMVGLIGCEPSTSDCSLLIPLDAEEIRVEKRDGMLGCAGEVQGIDVFVEATRVQMHWERARLFVDGDEVELEDFAQAIDYAVTRRKAEEIGEAAKEVIEQTGEAIKGFLDGIQGDQD